MAGVVCAVVFPVWGLGAFVLFRSPCIVLLPLVLCVATQGKCGGGGVLVACFSSLFPLFVFAVTALLV